jgi:hypothetical protein
MIHESTQENEKWHYNLDIEIKKGSPKVVVACCNFISPSAVNDQVMHVIKYHYKKPSQAIEYHPVVNSFINAIDIELFDQNLEKVYTALYPHDFVLHFKQK